jgi:hypothetical protein
MDDFLSRHLNDVFEFHRPDRTLTKLGPRKRSRKEKAAIYQRGGRGY